MSEKNHGLIRTLFSHGNYLVLLTTLFLLLALSPFAAIRLVRGSMAVIALGVLFAALRATGLRRGWLVVALITGLAGAPLSHLGDLYGVPPAMVTGAASGAVFFAVVVGAIISHLTRTKRVTMDTVYGATCVYLFLALIWAQVYTLIELDQEGSFSSLQTLDDQAKRPFRAMPINSQLLYFSLITLTTVGYGDISPVSPSARFLAALEGLIGPLYLAIMIARLVALEIAHRVRGAPE